MPKKKTVFQSQARYENRAFYLSYHGSNEYRIDLESNRLMSNDELSDIERQELCRQVSTPYLL